MWGVSEAYMKLSGSFTPSLSLTKDIGFGWSWWWCWAAVAGNSVRPWPSIGICWPSHGCTTTFVRRLAVFPQPVVTVVVEMFCSGGCFGDFRSFVSWRFCWQIAACCRSVKGASAFQLHQVRKNPKVHAGAPLFSICENLHTKLLGSGPEKAMTFVCSEAGACSKGSFSCKASEPLFCWLFGWGLWSALACRCTTTPWYSFWFLRSLGVFSLKEPDPNNPKHIVSALLEFWDCRKPDLQVGVKAQLAEENGTQNLLCLLDMDGHGCKIPQGPTGPQISVAKCWGLAVFLHAPRPGLGLPILVQLLGRLFQHGAGWTLQPQLARCGCHEKTTEISPEHQYFQ